MVLLLIPTPMFLVYGMLFCKVGVRSFPLGSSLLFSIFVP
jgi:hypothetical protein